MKWHAKYVTERPCESTEVAADSILKTVGQSFKRPACGLRRGRVNSKPFNGIKRRINVESGFY